MAQGTKTYFKNFFDEKEIPFAQWEIMGTQIPHIITSEFVIETLKQLPNNTDEAKKISGILRQIDYRNASVLPFLKDLAEMLVKVDGR